MSDFNFNKVVGKIAGAAMIVAPLAQMVAFAIHPQFLTFKHNTDAAVQYEYIQQFGWQLGHVLVYLSIPLMLLAWVKIAMLLKDKQPLLTFIGAAATWVGYSFLAGAFGAVMAQGTIGMQLPADQAVPAIKLLVENQGLTQLTFYGQILSLLGSVVLLVGLLRSKGIVPKWSAPLALLGNAIIVIFMDIDGYMIWGAAMILVGLLPLAVKLLKNEKSPS